MQARNGFRNSRVWLAIALLGAPLAACDAPGERIEAVATTMAPLLGATEGAIPEEYIVVFKDEIGSGGQNRLRAAMNRVALRSPESRIQHEYTIIPGFAARLSAADLAAIRQSPDVAYVERNGMVRATKIDPVQATGIDRIDQRNLPLDGLYDDYGYDGSGVRIYVIDSGVRPTHVELSGRVGGMYDEIGDGRNGQDCNGHGTHLASIAAGTQHGVADGATIYSVRVLNCDGVGTFSGVISGVNLVHEQCNSGAPCAANLALTGSASTALDDAVANAIAAGTPFAVAAGNGNTDACNVSPARVPAAVTVGAVDANDCRATFSNPGECVDIYAPGVGILGADGDDDASDTAMQFLTGTSQASAHVVGVMAEYLQAQPGATPTQVTAAIIDAATTVVCGAGPLLLLHNNVNGVVNNSCAGRCGSLDPSQACQCNDDCVNFGDCCPDYTSLCVIDRGSCADRCGNYDPTKSCQCNDDCMNWDDCCADYQDLCSGLVESCDGRCDTFDPDASCQCNEACERYGDCCADYYQACHRDGCRANNACGGQAPAGCYCDYVCEDAGDCCPDGPC